MKRYNWATLGCGVIANQLAEAMISRGDNLYSVANRTHEKALEFAAKYGIEYGIEKVYDKIDDVFEDENVDIIYISTPHNTHIEYLRKALKAGKHVLCEKSITLNSDELDEAIFLAEENHVVLAEAMTIFHMPIYKELNKIIESGKLGDLKLIQMNFGSYKEYDMTNRFFNKNLAGGAMLDIGVYALSFVRWFMSSKPTEILSQVKYAPTGVDEQASNKNLAGGAMLDIGVYALSFVRWFMSSKPTEILSQVKYAPTGVDEQASLLLKNKEEEMATVILSLHAKQPKRGTIAFDKGYVEIFEYPRGEEAVITYTEDGGSCYHIY